MISSQFFVFFALLALEVLPRAHASFKEGAKGNIQVDASYNLWAEAQSLGTCKVKRRVKWDHNLRGCLVEGCEDILSLDDVLADLNREATSKDKIELHNFVDPDENEAFGRALIVAGENLPRRNIAQDRIVGITNLAFLLTASVTWSSNGKLGDHFIIDSDRRSKQKYTPVCPVGEFEPVCDNVLCEGTNGKCTSEILQGCGCRKRPSCRRYYPLSSHLQ